MPLRLHHAKLFWVLAFMAGVAIAWCATPIRLLLNYPLLVDELNMAGMLGIGLFIVAHVVAAVVGIPGTILVVAGGAVYGFWAGTLWSVMGATLGAIAAFLVSRYLFHHWFEQHFGQSPVLTFLKRMMQHNALSCVLVIRLTPISPFNVMNFCFGLSPIDLKSYSLGTVLGIVPGTAIYTSIGVSGMKALHGEGIGQLMLSLSGLALLSALPMLIRWLQSRDTR